MSAECGRGGAATAAIIVLVLYVVLLVPLAYENGRRNGPPMPAPARAAALRT
ncbi:MAG: hypothetical protein LM577_06680 [Thermoproteaceae archaeon]|nr:hypothetical protein [Thermoproteaceae archaeon]